MEDSKAIIKHSAGADEESHVSANTCTPVSVDNICEGNNSENEVKTASISSLASNLSSVSSVIQEEKTVIKRRGIFVTDLSSRETDKGRDSSLQLKSSIGKRKVKMDWTPELHKKFVQAVEQLSVDKAVPSKILELMGTDCLTRHNVASHLQKYRSHQKHVLAREAESARWSRRHGGAGRKEVNPWVVPTTGFPQMATIPHFRPLHVWGHPSVDQSIMHLWPRNLAPSPCSSVWASGYPPPAPLPGDFWYYHIHDVPAPGMPCFPSPFTPWRFPALNDPQIQPAGIYRMDPVVGFPSTPARQTPTEPPFDFYPSKENIDAVIGDVLSKPWLPLPLGLNPPLIDSVMVELQRQGISKIPPSCA